MSTPGSWGATLRLKLLGQDQFCGGGGGGAGGMLNGGMPGTPIFNMTKLEGSMGGGGGAYIMPAEPGGGGGGGGGAPGGSGGWTPGGGGTMDGVPMGSGGWAAEAAGCCHGGRVAVAGGEVVVVVSAGRQRETGFKKSHVLEGNTNQINTGQHSV